MQFHSTAPPATPRASARQCRRFARARQGTARLGALTSVGVRVGSPGRSVGAWIAGGRKGLAIFEGEHEIVGPHYVGVGCHADARWNLSR